MEKSKWKDGMMWPNSGISEISVVVYEITQLLGHFTSFAQVQDCPLEIRKIKSEMILDTHLRFIIASGQLEVIENCYFYFCLNTGRGLNPRVRNGTPA